MTKYHPNLKILAFVGLAGTGKSSATNYVTSKNYPKVYFGGIILDAMDKAGLEKTPENEKQFRENYRLQYGKDSVANKIIEQIYNLQSAGQHHIVADGLYSWTEYQTLKKEFGSRLTVVALTAPKKLRYHRLKNRPVRPLSEEGVNERDISEIENLEKGGPIAIADYTIVNSINMDEFYHQIDELLEEIEF